MKSTLTTISCGTGVVAMLLAGTTFAQTADKVDSLEQIIVHRHVLARHRAIHGAARRDGPGRCCSHGRTDHAAGARKHSPTHGIQLHARRRWQQQRPGEHQPRELARPAGIGRRILNTGAVERSPPCRRRHQVDSARSGCPAALRRSNALKLVPDGGSSIYGADAVGGVLNMIPRKRFDGVQFDGRYRNRR